MEKEIGGWNMNRLIKAGLLVAGMASSVAQAAGFGDEDDTYLGFQITTQLDSHYRGFRWDANQYRYRYTQRINGIDNGVEISIDGVGRTGLNLLSAASGAERGRIERDYLVLPILRLDAQADSGGGTGDGAVNPAYKGIATPVLLGFFAKMVENQLEKPWTPVD